MENQMALTETEVHTLLSHLLANLPSNKSVYLSLRNTTIATLMTDAGLRVGETIQLTISDLLAAQGPSHTLIVPATIAKTHSPRQIPLTPRLANFIQQWTIYHRLKFPPPQPLWAFPSRSPARHITTRQVRRFIQSAGRAALNRDLHPHLLRHTFATRLMATTNIRIVQQLLGHTRLTSTQRYTHPTPDDLRVAINGLSAPTPPS